MEITIPKDSVLNNYDETTPPKVIFQAVCDLLGEHYSTMGFSYARSRPKITLKNEIFKIVIAFWSSGSNYAGGYVNLEIIGTVYSQKLAKFDKENNVNGKGLLLSHTDFTNKLNYEKQQGHVTVYSMDGKIVAERTEDLPYALDKHSGNYNIYGISQENLNAIKSYIDGILINPIIGLKNKDSFMEFIHNYQVNEYSRSTNKRLYKFVELELDNDSQLIEFLKKKGI